MLVSDGFLRRCHHDIHLVLILVLVDVGLGPLKRAVERLKAMGVLILVLVDVGLGPVTERFSPTSTLTRS